MEANWPRYTSSLYDLKYGVPGPDLEDKEEKIGFALEVLNRFSGHIVKVGEDAIGNIYQAKSVWTTLVGASFEFGEHERFVSDFLDVLNRITYDNQSRNLTFGTSDDRKLKFFKIEPEQTRKIPPVKRTLGTKKAKLI